MINQSLAVCDVSGSMLQSSGRVSPLYAATGLTLFLQHVSNPPWNRHVITFSESPHLVEVSLEEQLYNQVRKILTLDAGFNTDFNKVIDLIMNYGKEKKIPNDQMPKVLFIFSDMEFDDAFTGETNFETLKRQYADSGYSLPLVIFWNLKGGKTSRSTPVLSSQEGVFLLSGYSAQTLNFFFTNEDLKQLTPLVMLNGIIEDPRYNCITVC